MAKIMIVEDDRNLQSIYGDRLKAEGHTIITAGDGEEALAVAVKERPDLIISDVMMPKISGFDMLDILRTTPETRNVKIVMMTALSQAEDKERADKLGADKYLVKSQVTLDDVAKTVNEIVSGSAVATDATGSPATAPAAADSTPPTTDAAVPATAVDSTVADATQAAAASADSTADEQAKISNQIDDFISKNMPDSPAPTVPATSDPTSVPVNVPATPAPPAATTPEPVASSEPAASPSTTAPNSTTGPKPTIFELYEKELAKEAEAKAQEPTEPPKA